MAPPVKASLLNRSKTQAHRAEMTAHRELKIQTRRQRAAQAVCRYESSSHNAREFCHF